uniref:hypothetical protein n=1 Tax=Propionicicella superfundia TaxID=348582 RepID=UPI00048DA1C8
MTRGAAGLAKLLALALLSVPLAVAAPASADVPVPTEGSATPSAAESTVSPTATQQDGSQEAAQIVPGTDETSATQHDGSQESAQIVPGTDETSATQQDGSQESGQAVPGTDETSAATGSEPTSESAKPQSAAPGSSTPSAARGRQADADADWVLVKKVVDAPDGVSVPGGTAFGVDYTVDGGSSQTTSVSQDLPVLITGVRVGQEVSVAETGLPAAPDGYRWTTAAYGPREVTPGTGCYAGAGGAGGGGSDERLKQDITPLVTTTNGIQLY